MEFRREIEVAKIIVSEKVKETTIEVRYDPLTLQTSRIVSEGRIIGSTEGFDEYIEKSKDKCPFCDKNIERFVARDFEIAKGDLWKKGEAILFSNLVPYSKYSVIIRLSRSHYLDLSEFKPEYFLDAFSLAQNYINNLPEGRYYICIGMNYLKPAGSIVVHPHIHLLVMENSTDYFARLDWSALEFKERYNEDYWKSLVKVEKNGERYIGETEKTYWIAAYAPKGFYHVIGIPEEREFAKMSLEQLKGFSDGIVKILKYYKGKGLNSFNFTFFCADTLGEHFRTNFHIVARSPFSKYYWCDILFPKILHDETIVFFTPEDYAKELREIWEKL